MYLVEKVPYYSEILRKSCKDLCFRRVPLAGHLGAYGVGAIAKAVASRYTYLGNLRIAKHVLATCKCDKEA